MRRCEAPGRFCGYETKPSQEKREAVMAIEAAVMTLVPEMARQRHLLQEIDTT
jgi:hypothetical protein